MFLPATRKEMEERGWDYVDIVLVTGDAYVDHPSFGVALIGRLLESRGYRVAVLSQPKYENADDFRRFGRPELFFGITAGNLDSIVSNYTGNLKTRKQDDYSPGGNPYFGDIKSKASRRRPDRATIIYSNLAKQAYQNVHVILGGLEASLRRFVHYDFQQARLRASILTDAKADLLVYGMGENAVTEIARRLAEKEPLCGIAGTCERLNGNDLNARNFEEQPLSLPSWQNIIDDASGFLEAELIIDEHSRSLSKIPLVQQQQNMWVLQNPPAEVLSTKELDGIYSLPFVRAPHPGSGDVPAYRMICHSVTIVRGCSGNCSFCSISSHQGSSIVSRSKESVLEEVKRIAEMPDFKGTISDLGGPTANLYGTSCGKKSPCKRHDCLYPGICPDLKTDQDVYIDLLKKVSSVNKVKHVYVSSGLRMELLMRTPRLLERIIMKHIPGAMKIAPEHTDENILRLMHKKDSLILPQFLETCRNISKKFRKKMRFNPYVILSHPGCTIKDMERLAKNIRDLGLTVQQFQDFTPTPGTISTAMYVTGLDRDTKKSIHVVRTGKERLHQRNILENL